MGVAIDISGVSKSFKQQGKNIVALDNINLLVPEGEIFGFLGPNGAGKTTLIKIIMGILTPDSGNIHVMGASPAQPNSRRRLGYFPERPYMHDFLTAEEFLKFHGRLLNLEDKKINLRTPEVLKLVGLKDAAKLELKKFSKGMLQRIGLAQALLHDPDIVILDEPMSGLDPVGRREVRDLILGISKLGKTVFFSTHIVPDIEAICTNVGFINRGSLKAIDDISVALGKTLKSVEISFNLPAGILPKTIPSLVSARLIADSWYIDIPVNKSESLADVDTKVDKIWRDISSAQGAIRSVIPRKSDLEELFFEGVIQ